MRVGFELLKKRDVCAILLTIKKERYLFTKWVKCNVFRYLTNRLKGFTNLIPDILRPIGYEAWKLLKNIFFL